MGYKYNIGDKVVVNLDYFDRLYDLPECGRYGVEQEAIITDIRNGEYQIDYEYFEGEPLSISEEHIIRRL